MAKSAECGNIPRGALLQIVLPFDNATSLADQAATAHDAPLPSDLPGIPIADLLKLREQAVALRRLIRVKMADEADLQQAMGSVTLLDKLVKGVDEINMPIDEILKVLK